MVRNASFGRWAVLAVTKSARVLLGGGPKGKSALKARDGIARLRIRAVTPPYAAAGLAVVSGSRKPAARMAPARATCSHLSASLIATPSIMLSITMKNPQTATRPYTTPTIFSIIEDPRLV